MSTRSPEEILKAIEDAEFDVVVEQVLAMSPEERRRELEENGVDVEALRAEADAFYARLHEDDRVEPTAHRPDAEVRSGEAFAVWEAGGSAPVGGRIGPRWAALLAAALGAAAIGATAALPALLVKRDEGPSPHESQSSATASQPPSVRQLRERATSECRHRKWQECVDDLTAARTLDPAGDADERVQAIWRDALEGLDPRPRTAPKFDVK
jgi:hypothetical protein